MPKFHINKHFGPVGLKLGDFSLIQIGRMYFAALDKIMPHRQRDWYELTIITDGDGFVITNGIETPVKRGCIYLSLPDDMHEIRSSKEAPMKYDFFTFRTENPTYKAELENIAKILSPNDRLFFDERISALICDAIMEFIEERKYSTDLLYSIFNQIVIYMIRNFSSETAKSRVTSATPNDAVCYQIMNYIDTHLYTLKSLDELSDAMKYNYSYLSALFKKTTGNTLLSYYRNKRLEAARILILEDTAKISDIAEMLGYASLYSFSRAFKERYGTSPKQYSKESKKN